MRLPMIILGLGAGLATSAAHAQSVEIKDAVVRVTVKAKWMSGAATTASTVNRPSATTAAMTARRFMDLPPN